MRKRRNLDCNVRPARARKSTRFRRCAAANRRGRIARPGDFGGRLRARLFARIRFGRRRLRARRRARRKSRTAVSRRRRRARANATARLRRRAARLRRGGVARRNGSFPRMVLRAAATKAADRGRASGFRGGAGGDLRRRRRIAAGLHAPRLSFAQLDAFARRRRAGDFGFSRRRRRSRALRRGVFVARRLHRMGRGFSRPPFAPLLAAGAARGRRFAARLHDGAARFQSSFGAARAQSVGDFRALVPPRRQRPLLARFADSAPPFARRAKRDASRWRRRVDWRFARVDRITPASSHRLKD